MASLKRKAESVPTKERVSKKPKPVSPKKSKIEPPEGEVQESKKPKLKSSTAATSVPALAPTEGEAFRRGGAELLTPLEKKQIHARASRDALFEEENGHNVTDSADSDGDSMGLEQESPTSVKKQSKKKAKRSFDEIKTKSKKSLKLEGLSYKRIHKGMVILGCITSIGRRDITLALPNNLTGFVPLASVSEGIRRQLEERDEDSSDGEHETQAPQPAIDLTQFVSIGQYLRAVVTAVNDGSKRHIQLSSTPKDVNAGVESEDLVKHLVIQGEISSIEDHGAIINLALASANTKAFIPTAELGDRTLSTLQIGTPILCAVTSTPSNGKVVKLSANSKHLDAQHALKTVSNINSLLPGTVVEFVVLDLEDHGFKGRMMDMLDVTADIVHSGQFTDHDDGKAKISTGKKTKARIIFSSVKDDTHQIGVSILPHIMSLAIPASSDLEPNTYPTTLLPVSAILEETTVTKVDPVRGLLLDVGVKDIEGFAHISRISSKRVKDLSATSGIWREGSKHKGRVIGFNPMDGQFLVSLEDSVLELPFLSYEDAQPGQIVSGTVTKYKSKDGEIRAVIIKITDNTSGLIPAIHMSDVQLQFPEKKFKMDSTVQARVLSVDPDRRRLTLTCKKTLVNGKGPIWASYADVRVGATSSGTVVAFLPSGALIEFYNHLKAFLPTSEMSESFIKDPKTHFRIGQVVSLRAITVDADKARLVVSCRQDTETTDAAEKLLDSLSVGMIVSGKVSEKLPEECVVDIQNTGIKAVLPVSQLVDGSEQKCSHAAKRIRVDQTLQDLAIMNFNKTKRYIRLTKKPSLVEAFQSGRIPSSLDNLDVNMDVVGFVKSITDVGVFVQFANNLTGLLPKSQLAETSVDLPEFGLRKNQSIPCRILSVDLDQQRFILTQKQQKVDVSNGPAQSKNEQTSVANPIDGISSEFIMNQLTKAKVIAVKATQLNVKLADDVQGRIDISQLFDTWEKIKFKKQPLKSYQNGQTLDVRILGIHDARNHRFLPITRQRGNAVFELTARPSDQTTEHISRLSLADMKKGDAHLCFVNNVRSDHLWVNINTEIRGKISVLELTDDPEKISDLPKYYPIGCALQARVIQVNAAENRLDLSARPVDQSRPQIFEDLSVGQAVVGKVSKTSEKLVIVQISDNVSGAIHICDMEDDFSKSNPKDFRLGQAVSCIVVSLDREKQDVWLSRRPSVLLKANTSIRDPELSTIKDLKVDDKRRAFIKNITDKGLFVSLSRDLTAFIRVSELFDQFVKNWKDRFNLNQLVEGKIIAVRTTENQIQMSLKQSILDGTFTPSIVFEDIKVGQIFTGWVRKVEIYGAFVVLDNSTNVSGLCHRAEMADGIVPPTKDLYNEGDAVKVKVLKVDTGKKRISLGMKASYFSSETEVDQEASDGDINGTDAGDSDPTTLDAEMMSSDEDGGIEILTHVGGATHKVTPVRVRENGHKELGGLEIGGFDWTGGLANADDDIEMLDAEEKPTAAPKKRHGAAAIQVDKTGDLDTHGAQSSSDFERLLMGQPNSSYLWLSYMAFHLQLSEVEKARQIAERALRTMNGDSPAIQDEALNVWIGLLNLENSYGSDESIEDVFKRACTHSDPKEVYTRLTSIYIQSGKQDKAITLFEEMIKKFSSDPKVWQNYASFLFDVAEDATKARALLPRAMQSLPAHTHIDIATKFAHLEYKSSHGDNERGRTIFEGLITNFPKRLDLWNVLLDLEIKSGSKDQVRQLFDRVTSGKIKVQKAKFFFKKWLDYEEKHGDAKSQEKVKAKAAEFVRKHEEAKA